MKYLLVLFLSFKAYGFDNFKVWEKVGCFQKSDFRYPDETNPALLQTICQLVISNPDWKFFWHSDGRPISQHTLFNAVDFHLSDYSGLTKLEILIQFRNDIELFEKYLENNQLTDVVGFGIYPDQNNPFFHLDFRGRRARWGRVGRNYVGIDFAKEWLNEQIISREQSRNPKENSQRVD